MIPNLDFIKTLVNGLWFKIQRLVTSVNGQTGDVKLTAESIGAMPDTFTETDPTVPDWAKQPEKPSYTAKEVGALSDTTKIPGKTSDLINDSGFLTGKPSYTVSEIENAAPTADPVFTGSISMGREAGFDVGVNSVALGDFTKASGSRAHAEGYDTTASGENSHAEGFSTTASGESSHAEGIKTTASGRSSHAEGNATTASNSYSHAEGWKTTASGGFSHAEGIGTIASTTGQHAQGSYNVERKSPIIHVVGNGSDENNRSNAHTLDESGNAWFAGDVYVGSTSGTDMDEGSKKLATEEYVNSVAMGNVEVPVYGVATPEADGLMSKEDKAKLDGLDGSSGGSSGGSGVGVAGTGEYAEVFNGGAAENASGTHSHAEGLRTIASSLCSHAEGQDSKASSEYSHAEGWDTAAEGMAAHAEGIGAIANGFCSHAEGTDTLAKGAYSHAEGEGTIAASRCQHAQGSYNVEDASSKYLHIVGNGTSDTARSNAHTLDWNGNAWFAGSVEGTALILTSPGGKRFRITVDDDGTLQSAEVTG